MPVADQTNPSPYNANAASAARCFALIPAAGIGSRMAGDMPKQYLPLLGKPMIWHALNSFAGVERIDHIFVVLAPDDTYWCQSDYLEFAGRLSVLRCGGDTRAASVGNGLAAIDGQMASDCSRDWVLVHDAARPCVTVAQIHRLIDAVSATDDGGILAVPVADTLKRARPYAPAQVDATVPRDLLWQAQTPQMFRHGALLNALRRAPHVTDESSAMEALNVHPLLVEADASNLKITYPRDLQLAELILGQRQGAPS